MALATDGTRRFGRTSGNSLHAALLLAVALLGPSCGGDGGGTPAGGPCLEFSPAASPVPGTVSTRVVANGCSTIDLELQITDVTDVFAVQFTVTFDPLVVAFESMSTAGSLLESDGASLGMQIDPSPGMVDIGVTRLAPSGRDAVGTARLLTLRFRQEAAAGATLVSYGDTRVLGSETPPQEKPGISWTGGTAESL
ncbi:MAG: cohesin domain-containing protein [Acidobacteriota bacterium]|jgi:hypothetical protein